MRKKRNEPKKIGVWWILLVIVIFSIVLVWPLNQQLLILTPIILFVFFWLYDYDRNWYLEVRRK